MRLYHLPLEELGALADRRRQLAKASHYAGQGNRIVTSGFKQAHYARGMIGAEVIVANSQDCLHAALTGRWTDAPPS